MKRRFGSKQFKFAAVGALNTTIDFLIFILLAAFGMMPIFANIISTSCGMVCSFILNRSFVFGPSSAKAHHEILKFLLITLSGLWIIQSAVIFSSNTLLNSLFSIDSGIIMNTISKILATGVSLVWNYYWYKNYVFKNVDERQEEEA